MDFVADCQLEVAAELSKALLDAGCEYTALKPKQMTGLEITTAIIIPITLTSLQIVVQLWAERNKQKPSEIKIYIDGKEFVPSKESLDRIKNDLR